MQNGCELAGNSKIGHLGGYSFHYFDKKVQQLVFPIILPSMY